jgi:hypothetical protein
MFPIPRIAGGEGIGDGPLQVDLGAVHLLRQRLEQFHGLEQFSARQRNHAHQAAQKEDKRTGGPRHHRRAQSFFSVRRINSSSDGGSCLRSFNTP